MTEYFYNPIIENGPDPFVLRHADRYYYCYSTGAAIFVSSADNIHHLSQNGREIWRPAPDKPYSKNLWAPEIHEIDGAWYLYVACDNGANENHRMYVCKSDGGPDGNYSLVGKISDDADKWAIDGTVMQRGGRMYFVWSGWEGDVDENQNLYIAEMRSPTEIGSARVMLSAPQLAWERRGSGLTASGRLLPGVNEGPQILQRGDTVHIVYSAAGSWCRHYCLGMLTLRGGDPLDAENWIKSQSPVFVENEGTHGPGHCSFTTAPDGTDFIVYHARRDEKGGWAGRGMRAQPFTWDGDMPRFGAAAKPTDRIEIASAE
ncbi:MAG: glycoside hydrolase family 43 protein [Clostridia bacterium]|nr:glycoside hydrolase family 43 protein [Clostridia bacterium]